MIDNKDILHKKIPLHVAIIMDGNGRWAKKQGEERIFGHKNAIQAVRDAVEQAAESNIKYLTLYTFSEENWNRPRQEVLALMELLVDSLNAELETLMKNNIRLNTIGNIEKLPENCLKNLKNTLEKTKHNTHMTLTLALSYGARDEIIKAVKKISSDIKNGEISIKNINEELFNKYLFTKNIPDPELIIRTSGEQRISNFLLWQIAYSEFYFTDILWPDFRKEHFIQAIENYQNRERRFGKTSEQIAK